MGLDKSQTLGSQPEAVQCEYLEQITHVPLLNCDALSDLVFNSRQNSMDLQQSSGFCLSSDFILAGHHTLKRKSQSNLHFLRILF